MTDPATAPASGPTVGVVVMAYGTPSHPDQIEPYYTHIRRGRPPSPEQLADLTRRYDALGGSSTLAARTADQVAAVAEELERLAPGRFVVRLGQKHAAPFIEDAVAVPCRDGEARFRLALSRSAYTALRSFVESAPPESASSVN